MQFDQDPKYDFKDVLIRPKRSVLTSRSQVDLTREFTFAHSKQVYKGIPIIAANMDTIGTFEMANALTEHKLSVAIHKHYDIEELKEFFFGNNITKHWYSMGITSGDLYKFTNVMEQMDSGYVCVDVANGYQEVFVEFVSKLRSLKPNFVIMAGNVVTAEMTEALIIAGADIVKVGIGSGSVCTTRIKAGVGIPQLSAIIECADAAHGLKGLICSDGGITTPGDLGKAFGAGADFVMLGGMLAGHDECGGEIIYETHYENHNSYSVSNALGQAEISTPVSMKFYGMSSDEAMLKHSGGTAKHRAAEGKSVQVPYRGQVSDTILDILGGLRSTATYIGAEKLKEFSKRTTFVKVQQQYNPVFGVSS